MSRLLPAFFLVPALLFAQHPLPTRHKLVVIAVDGLDARFLNDPALHIKAPNIRELMRTGASASVIGVAPSDTLLSSISIATGVTPDEHGGAVLKKPALWREGAKAGLKIAAVYWPVISSPDAAFNFPPDPNRPAGNAVPFEPISHRSTPPGVADRVESMFPSFEKQVWDDSSASQASAWILASSAPDLLLVQLTDLAAEQRQTTGFGVYARESLENDDDLIGQILARIPKDWIVVVVSGHGVENQNYVVRPRVLLKNTGKIEVSDGLIGTTDGTVADRLRGLMKDGHRHGLAREVSMNEVRAKAPSLSAWVAAFDTPTNYVASAEDRGPALGPGTHLGMWGLWPTRPGFRSVFIIAGEGVRARKMGEIDLLQIAPTLADVLGVKLPDAKMNSLWPTVTR